jgi:hypothetical protein
LTPVALEQQLDNLVLAAPVLTPRPATVPGVAAPLLSLNGTWEFVPAAGVAARPIEVPGEWAMQGFEVPAGGFATCARHVDVPADWRGMTVKLRFDAVHAVCDVLVNGQAVGGHEGGFVPFELDVTKAIRPGRNEVVVRVQSESVADSVACISQYAAHQVGGIIRKVALYCVPAAHVSRQWHETTVTGRNARVVVHTDLDTGATTGRFVVAHRLLDPSGRSVATSEGPSPMVVRGARLWTSETPDLYTLETTLSAGGRPVQTLRERVGLREVRVEGNRLLVNGHPVKLLGVNRHEVHPIRGRSLTPELCRKDAELFRAANVNIVRTSHYPPSEEFLDACDELGIFVESEAAICWVMHGASPIWKTWNHLDPKFFPYLLRATLDNIAANRNHPSVLIWSLGNESMWTALFAKVLEVAKKDDPTRPFTFHDQALGGYNNAGTQLSSTLITPDPVSRGSVPMLSRDRVATALGHEQPDRAPVFATYAPEVERRLRDELGLTADDVGVALGNDMVKACVGLENSFNGLPEPEYTDAWGIRWRYVRNAFGAFTEIAEHPLAGDRAKLDSFEIPDPGEPSQYEPFARAKARYGRETWLIGSCQISIFEAAWYLRGLQQTLMDMVIDRDYVHALMDKVMRFPLAASRRFIELGADMVWFGDDVSMQTGMMMQARTASALPSATLSGSVAQSA